MLTDLILVVERQTRILTGNLTVSTLAFPRKREANLGTVLFPILVFLTQGRGSLTDLVLAV